MSNTVEILGFAREAGWLPWAVQYFFLIGASIGAFLLSLPGLALRLPAWRGLSRRALLAALVCGLAAPVALLADLHQPGRFLNFYLHPNLGSWMAWGSFFIPLYLTGLLLYAWLCLRPDLAALAGAGGAAAPWYRRLAYGGHDNPRAIRGAAAAAGLGAVLVLLYTGMEVMVVGARPLWNTWLLPVVFLVTAFSAGVGITALCEIPGGASPFAAGQLKRWLAASQAVLLGLFALWLGLAISGLSRPAADAFAAVSASLGWQVTAAWLFATTGLTLWVARRPGSSLWLPALLALHGAWAVRWIVFMGGQAIPKMGAASPVYSLSLTPDSLLGIAGTAGLCVFLYIVLAAVVPWREAAEA